MRLLCRGHRPHTGGFTLLTCSSLLPASRRRTFAASPQHLNHQHGGTRLPSAPARTRFAPSPTGFLHLGSLRTALFNYLLARKTGGQFLLRLEDTDAKRTVDTAEARLYEDLRWAGLQWDEGPEIGGPYGPYRQSDRTAIYKEHAHQLLDTPHAYRCFCSVERLDELARRRQALGLPTDYDRLCAGLSKEESDERASRGEPHVIRLKAPQAYPEFKDLIYGKVGKDKSGANAGITVKHGEIAYEDPVLLKSDGRPTYHLANVVDDHLMHITHVVRATEWISSTPKHLALYRAFNWQPPQYAHVGLLVDASGRKLSKRNFDTNVRSYRDQGLLPDAMLNFAALLGWSHGRKSDVMDLADLVREFQMKFTKGNTTVTLDKLWFLQRNHAARAAHSSPPGPSFQSMVDGVLACLDHDKTIEPLSPTAARIEQVGRRDYISRLLTADAKNYETPQQFVTRNRLFFAEPDWTDLAAEATETAAAQVLDGSHPLFKGRQTWTAAFLDVAIKAAAAGSVSGSDRAGEFLEAYEKSTLVLPLTDAEKEAYRAACRWIRHVLFTSRPGPHLGLAMELLGPEVCAHRLHVYQQQRHAETGAAGTVL